MNTWTCGYVPDMVCKSVAESCIYVGERDRVGVTKAIAGSCTFAGRQEVWNRGMAGTADTQRWERSMIRAGEAWPS